MRLEPRKYGDRAALPGWCHLPGALHPPWAQVEPGTARAEAETMNVRSSGQSPDLRCSGLSGRWLKKLTLPPMEASAGDRVLLCSVPSPSI